jgi:hypothetical protein
MKNTDNLVTGTQYVKSNYYSGAKAKTCNLTPYLLHFTMASWCQQTKFPGYLNFKWHCSNIFL